MKREDLKKLGLEEEQIDSIMQLHGETLNAVKAEKSTLETENAELTNQIGERDRQLTALRKEAGENVEMQRKIDELTELNKKTQTELEQKLQQQELDHAIDKALLAKKAKNLKAAKVLIDTEGLQVGKDGKVAGLDEQLKDIVKENGFLFGDDRLRGIEPNDGVPGSPQDGFLKDMASQFNSKQSGGSLDW